MRPELVLGFDPAPADAIQLVAVAEVVRTSIVGLVEARHGLDRLARVGSVWDGPGGAPLATVVRRYSARLLALEEVLVVCLGRVDEWRDGVERRQAETAHLVDQVAAMAGSEDSADRRARLEAAAREVADEHERAAGQLAVAFEDLSAAAAQITGADDDLAGDLDRALVTLVAAVDEWITAEAPALLRTALALGEVAGLTTVISELVGIAALGRAPDGAPGVGDLIAQAPASHRLVRALRRQWAELAPSTLPEATFASRRPGALAQALAGPRGTGAAE